MQDRKHQDWFLISLAYLSLFTFGFIDNGRGAIFPDLLHDFGLSDSRGALFFLVASAAALANNLVGFDWMSRLGPYRSTRFYSVIQALGLVIIGFAPNYRTVLAGAVMVGASLGGTGISVNLLAAEGATVPRRRQILSGLHSMYGISSLGAPLLITLLYSFGLSWRHALGWLAIGPLAVVAQSFLRPAPPKPVGDVSLMVPRTPDGRRQTIFFASLCTFYVLAEVTLGTRLALFARRVGGYEAASANRLLSLFFLGLFLGRLGLAVRPIRWSHAKLLLASSTLGFVSFALGIVLSPAWFAAAGFAMSVYYPCAVAFINDVAGSRAQNVTSWCITAQNFGLVLLQAALGLASDHFGLASALWLGAGCLAMTAALILARRRFAVSAA